MGGGQPFMYDAPASYSHDLPYKPFNPKQVTQASHAPVFPVRPKPTGPLLNFNRHPDSYHVSPFGRTEDPLVAPNLKKKVDWARGLQTFLRAVELVGSLGLLVCVILIKNTSDNEGWIIRAPPAADILITVYAIYHLSRPAKARPPQSSASYHFFATCIDMGMVPFYVFTLTLARNNFEEKPDKKDRWVSYIQDAAATNLIFQATLILAAVLGILHILSFGFDLWLLSLFRGIAQLPPDMNPLESNLTSRRKTKHKYKTSSLSDIRESRYSQVSSTVDGQSSPSRKSQIYERGDPKAMSTVSFFQSRIGQENSFSAHNPITAEYARNQRLSAMPADPMSSKRSSFHSTPTLHEESEVEGCDPPDSKQDLRQDNWFVVRLDQAEKSQSIAEKENLKPADDEDEDDYDPYRASAYKQNGWVNKMGQQLKAAKSAYEPVPGVKVEEVVEDPSPLRMNPPTPVKVAFMSQPDSQLLSGNGLSSSHPRQRSERQNHPLQEVGVNRTHTMTSATSHYSDDETEISGTQVSTFSTAPKLKLYGDLAAAMRGVRHDGVVSPRPTSMIGSVHYGGSEASNETASSSTQGRTRNAANKKGPKSMEESVSGTLVRKDLDGADPLKHEQRSPARQPQYKTTPRVVSRTGVDFMTAESDLGLSGSRRREVSGKVAEEGRGGAGWGAGIFRRKASGVAQNF